MVTPPFDAFIFLQKSAQNTSKQLIICQIVKLGLFCGFPLHLLHKKHLSCVGFVLDRLLFSAMLAFSPLSHSWVIVHEWHKSVCC